MIQITDKQYCCGCSACKSACPGQCIAMRVDEEGFLYPEVNVDKCVDCGLCERVCPILNRAPEQPRAQQGYIVQHRDADILRQSTSGGAFTAIAQYVIAQGGVVFGAAFDEHCRVVHTSAGTVDELAKLRGSKYVQSDPHDSFTEVRALLEAGRPVCFSGTPCQIEGLKCFLGREYDKLLTVDVVCRACASPMVLAKYLDVLGMPENPRFRDKHYGYDYTVMSVDDAAGRTKILGGVDTNPYLRAFFSNICDRPSCYDCRFKKRYRVSDITLRDCFQPLNIVSELPAGFRRNSGQTGVLTHSEKGAAVMAALDDSLICCAVDPGKLADGETDMMLQSVPMNPRRAAFFEDARGMNGAALFQKWFPVTLKHKFVHGARVMLSVTGLTPFARKIGRRAVLAKREQNATDAGAGE